MRPILLAAVTSLAGFVPLLLSTCAGSASRISIGTVVFSGLLVSTVLSLLVLSSAHLLLCGLYPMKKPRHMPGLKFRP